MSVLPQAGCLPRSASLRWRLDAAMVALSEEMKRVVLEQKLGFAATVCPDSTPNLSPKGTTTVLDDDHLLFADIWSPQTVRNLEDSPAIEINVVDPVIRKGFRFKGCATLHSAGDVYERGLRLLAERGYDIRRHRVNHIVVVAVERAAPLISPAYAGGVGEHEVAARWKRYFDALYGERPPPTEVAS